jgi:hypothetical protein
MASQTPDRFDRVPADLERVGAHRALAKQGRGWVGFAWAALATGILVVAGLFGLSLLGKVDLGLPTFSGGDASTPTATPTPTPTATPLTDPATLAPERGIQITVLNGSPTEALDDVVGGQLAALAWPVGAMTQASDRTIEKTYIYYADPLNEDVARGIAITLGVGEIRLVPVESMPSSAPIAIVLGADFPAAGIPAG